MANPNIPLTRADQVGTATGAVLILTVPAPPPGSTNYFQGVVVTGAPGTVAGASSMSIVEPGAVTWIFTLVNPIAGGLIFEFLPTKEIQFNGSIVVTIGNMGATSGTVFANVFA